MKYNKLGDTDIEVSRICLGTMTWGEQNTEAEADAPLRAYLALAQGHGLDPAQMALAFINSRLFLTANIIGATSMAQLRTNIGSINLELSSEILDGIEAIHRSQPNPCP